MVSLHPALITALLSFIALAAVSCGDDKPPALGGDFAGAAGQGGQAGTAGSSGASGSVGTGGTAGASGSAGTGGDAGASGSAGTGGDAGASGSAGAGGDAGASGSAGAGGTAGAGGDGGSGGTAGAGGAAGASGTGGAAGSGTGGAGGAAPVACTSTNQCAVGELCSWIEVSSTQVDAYCRQEQAMGAPLGAPCQSDADCRSQLCPSWILSCTQACTNDIECSSGNKCIDGWQAGSDYVELCVPGCSRAADCGGGATCVFASDTANDLKRPVCEKPLGSMQTGADCSAQKDCVTGLCLAIYQSGQVVEQVCTEPCMVPTDCPAGFTMCDQIQVATPSGQSTQLLRACNR